jgi:hypothetical protein
MFENGGKIMEPAIPEEIKEKLKIVEKEMGYSKRKYPPGKKWIMLGSIWCLLAIIVSIGNKNFYEIACYLILGAFYFAIHFENKKSYKLYSAAFDIINYYKGKETTSET